MKNYLIQGPCATGKTRAAKCMACMLLGKIKSKNDYSDSVYRDALSTGRVFFLQMHENYCYEDFIAGIEVNSHNGTLAYSKINRIFLNVCDIAQKNRDKRVVIIIDDIDRVDITSVFGELLFGIENRGSKVVLKNGLTVSIPENLYIIATTAVVDLQYKADYAFLRRFYIISTYSDENILNNIEAKAEYRKYNGIVANYLMPAYKDQEQYYLLGHGVFMADTDENLKRKIFFQVIPLLKQYVQDGIMEMSFRNFKVIAKAAENNLPASVQNVTFIEKYKGSLHMTETFEDVIKYLDEIMTPEANGKLKRGSAAKVVVSFFDIIRLSGLLDGSVILAGLFLNTQLLDVAPFPKGIAPHGSYLVVKDDWEKYSYKTGNSQDTDKRSKYYPLDAQRGENKPSYIYNDIEYALFTAVRDEEQPVRDEGFVTSSTSAPHVVKILYVLVVAYYKLYLEALKSNINANNQILYKIVQDDYRKLGRQEGKFFNLQGLYSWMKQNLVVFWKKKGDVAYLLKECAVMEGFGKMVKTTYKSIMDDMNIKQMILQGPPGTSKTYGVKNFLKEQAGVSDFAGLDAFRITSDDYDKSNAGTFRTSKKLLWDIVQFHPSYGYEDFIRGIDVKVDDSSKVVSITGEMKNANGTRNSINLSMPSKSNIQYESVNKILGKIAKIAIDAGENVPVYLVIDEINRAKVASVFGELIYALECRGEHVVTPYKVNGDNSIVIPSNLYIIGTMNTADKSIGSIDYAIRRRFLFFPCLPDRKCISLFGGKAQYKEKLFDIVSDLFEQPYLSEDYNKDDIQVGHTYFLAKDDNELKMKFVFQILPILREYYKDGILLASDNQDNNPTAKIANYLYHYGKKSRVSEESLWNELSVIMKNS